MQGMLKIGALSLIAVILAVPMFASTVTYTTQSSFAAATTSLTTENFDSAAVGEVTGPIDGLTFTGNLAGGGSLFVTNLFDTTSSPNYLGTDPAIGGAFGAGDKFTVTLPASSTAIGLYLLIGGSLNAGDFTLSTSSGNALNSDTPDAILGDGTEAYFLGLTSDTAFTSATISLTTPGGEFDGPVWNADDISYGSANSNVTPPPPVPEPASLLLVGTGLAAMIRRLKRA